MIGGSRDRIVEDGRDRLKRDGRHRELEQEVREAVRRRHGRALRSARGLRRVLAYLRMRREAEALAPRNGSYLRSS